MKGGLFRGVGLSDGSGLGNLGSEEGQECRWREEARRSSQKGREGSQGVSRSSPRAREKQPWKIVGSADWAAHEESEIGWAESKENSQQLKIGD